MTRQINKITIAFLCTFFFIHFTHAQEFKIFEDIEAGLINKEELFISPQSFRTVHLDADIFAQKTSNIPHETELNPINSSTILSFPMPNGSEAEFKVVEYSMMESELAAAFPNIKTYLGVGVKNPHETIRFDYTAHGLRVVIRLEKEMVYIDPVDKNNSGNYISYYRKDLINEEVHTCHAQDELVEEILDEGSLKTSNCGFQRYRLAVAATAEYSAFFSATSPADEALVLSAITTSINRVNEIYERDLGVRLVLVNGMEALFYYNAATDPYTNNNPSAMLAENQTNITSVIGTTNFDIGHVVSTAAGGVASLNSPCNENYKARGVTGLSVPQGDVFDIDFLSHEIGHQFGASHTFNNSCGGNISTASAFEPGSGSTIMGYAGTCSPNVQANSDAYFHAISLFQINAFLNGSSGSSCATIIPSINNQPEANAGNDLIIPISTPFYLEGSGSDVDGDALTFCWEQMDNEMVTQSPVNTSIEGPTFRSYLPSTDSVRFFPNLNDLATGGATTWEVLPAVSRDLNFRLTVRDNSNTSAGCFAFDDMLVSVDATAGPFVVNVPSNTGISWTEGSRQTVTWDVANTDATPINCSKVDILLSYDGGLSYPTLLVTNVDNDGSARVTIPEGTTSTAKIMVKSVGNVFFDISNNDFTIAAGSSDFSLAIHNPENSVCGGDDAIYDITVGSISSYSSPILLSVSDAPTDVTVNFSGNPITPGSTVQMTISGTSSLAIADYLMTLNGTPIAGGATPKSIDFIMQLGTKPGNTIQVSPTNNEENIALRPTFTWNAASNATGYELQISTDPSFTTIDVIEQSLATTHSLTEDLESATSYFWRVRGLADCGEGEWSIPLIFTTHFCTTYVQSLDMSFNDGGDAYSDLTIADEGTVASVEVLDVYGIHFWSSDITASLISPGATEVTLWSGLCGSNEDFSLSLKDNAANTLAMVSCDPLGGGDEYQPAGTLSDFDTELTNGDWRLKLNDSFGGDDYVGVLQNWSLKICIEDYIAADPGEGNSALPLELLSFSARAQVKTIMLEWEAIYEQDIAGYEIERREEGATNFDWIGRVEISNGQNLQNTYKFEDKFVEKGIKYQYRLRMLDYSGEIKYSKIKEAQISKEGLILNVYPNPASDAVSIEYLGEHNRDLEIKIIDIAGKKVAEYNLVTGNNLIDISNLYNGVYIIKTIGENSISPQRLVVN